MAYDEKFNAKKMYLIFPKPGKDWKVIPPFKINDKELLIKTVDLQKDIIENIPLCPPSN
jgi:hypothetical protein